MEREIWREIPNTEGKYEASNLGRIKRRAYRRTLRLRPWLQTFQYKEKILKPCRHANGYLGIHVGHTALVHKLILLTFVGPRPAGHQCCHNNGKRDDNRLSNLRYDLPKNNAADRKLHGTWLCGEETHLAVLTANQVRWIFKNSGRMSKQAMAAFLGVHRKTISGILNGDSWRHIYDEKPRHGRGIKMEYSYDIDGTTYESAAKVSGVYGINRRTVIQRCNSKFFTTWARHLKTSQRGNDEQEERRIPDQRSPNPQDA